MEEYDYLREGLSPGDKVSAIQQCQKAFGSKFVPHVKASEKPFEVDRFPICTVYYVEFSPLRNVAKFSYLKKKNLLKDLCRELWCANSTHALRAHPALEGTDCSSKPYPYGSVTTTYAHRMHLWEYYVRTVDGRASELQSELKVYPAKIVTSTVRTQICVSGVCTPFDPKKPLVPTYGSQDREEEEEDEDEDEDNEVDVGEIVPRRPTSDEDEEENEVDVGEGDDDDEGGDDRGDDDDESEEEDFIEGRPKWYDPIFTRVFATLKIK